MAHLQIVVKCGTITIGAAPCANEEDVPKALRDAAAWLNKTNERTINWFVLWVLVESREKKTTACGCLSHSTAQYLARIPNFYALFEPSHLEVFQYATKTPGNRFRELGKRGLIASQSEIPGNTHSIQDRMTWDVAFDLEGDVQSVAATLARGLETTNKSDAKELCEKILKAAPISCVPVTTTPSDNDGPSIEDLRASRSESFGPAPAGRAHNDPNEGQPSAALQAVLAYANTKAQVSDLGRGVLLREAGVFKNACKTLEDAIRDEPEYARYYSNVAHAHAKLGDMEAAIANLELAAKKRKATQNIEWPRYHYHLARYRLQHCQKVDRQKAVQHLTFAVLGGQGWQEKCDDCFSYYPEYNEARSKAQQVTQERQRHRKATLSWIRRETEKIESVLHVAIYGSFSLDQASSFRDIDVVAVVEGEGAELLVMSFEGTPVNIYVVGKSVLQNDVKHLEYGQFYSYKYALGAQGVVNQAEVNKCVLDVTCQAIRDSVGHAYAVEGESLFHHEYSIDWFVASVLKRRTERDATFWRCLRRFFDHFTDGPLRSIIATYDRALNMLLALGELTSGTNPNAPWVLDSEKVHEWANGIQATDPEVSHNFWKTYEKHKSDQSGGAATNKKAVTNHKIKLARLTYSQRRDIEARLEKLLTGGRFPIVV